MPQAAQTRKKVKTQVVQQDMKFEFKGTVDTGEKSLEQLEKEFDIASARYCYAIQQRHYWEQQMHSRGEVFNTSAIQYRKKKQRLTEDDLKVEYPRVSLWQYTK